MGRTSLNYCVRRSYPVARSKMQIHMNTLSNTTLIESKYRCVWILTSTDLFQFKKLDRKITQKQHVYFLSF